MLRNQRRADAIKNTHHSIDRKLFGIHKIIRAGIQLGTREFRVGRVSEISIFLGPI